VQSAYRGNPPQTPKKKPKQKAGWDKDEKGGRHTKRVNTCLFQKENELKFSPAEGREKGLGKKANKPEINGKCEEPTDMKERDR